MLFKKLNIKNIRSYENLEITFPSGAVLLAGEIGSGKTSILLGLQFALFGLQPGQKGSSILRQGEDNAFARLEMEVDGQEVILERTIKKSKNLSITQDSNIIVVNGQREELSTSEMKDRVIRLLNYPREFIKKSNLLYKFTVYTPQEGMKEIIQEKPEVRLDTLRHIFGIDRYKRIKDNVQILTQKLKESIKIKEVLASELNILKEKYTLENEKKIALAKGVNNLDIEDKKLAKEKLLIEEKLNLLQDKIASKRNLSSEIEKTILFIQGKKENETRIKKDLALMQKQILEKIEFSPSSLESILKLFEKHKKILEEKNELLMAVSSLISALNSKKENPLRMKEKVMGIENCPTCFQGVSHEHKEKISKIATFEIEDINRELEQKLIEKQNLLKEIEKEKSLLRGYESDKNKLLENKIRFEHQKQIEIKIKSESFVLDRVSNELIDLDSRLINFKKDYENLEGSLQEFEKIKEDYKLFTEKLNLTKISLATKNKELELVRGRLLELSEEINSKEKIRGEINHLRGLQDWLLEKFIPMITVTEKNVMAKLRMEFSNIFQDWFSSLVSDSLSVRLDEDFTPIISNQDYEIEYDFLSGGERTAVALAYRLSLNQVLNSMLSQIKTKDILILDEPTDGFASEQIDKMRDIFDQLKAKQMILVSHEQKIEGFVDHVIRVRKDGTSSIESS